MRSIYTPGQNYKDSKNIKNDTCYANLTINKLCIENVIIIQRGISCSFLFKK